MQQRGKNKKRKQRTIRRHGLRYGLDNCPGIRRVTTAHRITYLDKRGRSISNANTLARIRSLAIPPAWKNVWIAPRANQHLQATGYDARGRKQYRYHPRWRDARDASKYRHLADFIEVLPRIRRRVGRDLARRGLPREKILAAIVRLLEKSLIRIGNGEYARTNQSYGLTTMQNRHAKVRGERLQFHFRGKSGKVHDIEIESETLARIVRKCQDLPGQKLFEYIDDDGKIRAVDSGDVNAYLGEISGREITAKDFRTWAGTSLAVEALEECEEFDSEAQAKTHIRQAIGRIAAQLGNTAAICRKCYIHPAVIAAYLDRSLSQKLRRKAAARHSRQLNVKEAAIIGLIR